jgi:hypothetical protein
LPSWFDAPSELKDPDKEMNTDVDAILELWWLCAEYPYA